MDIHSLFCILIFLYECSNWTQNSFLKQMIKLIEAFVNCENFELLMEREFLEYAHFLIGIHLHFSHLPFNIEWLTSIDWLLVYIYKYKISLTVLNTSIEHNYIISSVARRSYIDHWTMHIVNSWKIARQKISRILLSSTNFSFFPIVMLIQVMTNSSMPGSLLLIVGSVYSLQHTM